MSDIYQAIEDIHECVYILKNCSGGMLSSKDEAIYREMAKRYKPLNNIEFREFCKSYGFRREK